MKLKLQEKKIIVEELKTVADSAISAAVVFYRGLTVTEITRLRAQARTANVYIKVVRNTLSHRALDGTAFACLQTKLTGPVLLAFSMKEPGAAAQLMSEFSREHEKLEVVALAIDGKLLGSEHLEMMAKLPTYLEAIALLMSVMKASMTQFVRTLNEPVAKWVRTCAAVHDKKKNS